MTLEESVAAFTRSCARVACALNLIRAVATSEERYLFYAGASWAVSIIADFLAERRSRARYAGRTGRSSLHALISLLPPGSAGREDWGVSQCLSAGCDGVYRPGRIVISYNDPTNPLAREPSPGERDTAYRVRLIIRDPRESLRE